MTVQSDDPRMVTEYDSMDPAPSSEQSRKFATMRIEALNHALAGPAEDRVRDHMCWGSWHGPHTTYATPRDLAPAILQLSAAGICLEAGNPRRQHENHVW